MKILIALIIEIQIFFLVSGGYVDFMTDLNYSQIAAIRVKRARPTCTQPPLTPDKNYSIKFSFKDEPTDAKPGQTVPENAIISYQCNRGFVLDYDNEESHETVSICKSKSWLPPILKCKRICMNFSNFSNFNITCFQYLGGPKIPCTGLLLEGAVVKPRCQQKYRPDKNVDYDHATCQENGNWDKEFFSCIPECGATASSSVNLIANGQFEKRGGAPWNVVIYSTQKDPQIPEFICGGTLITAELALSAAHCFYDERFHQKLDIGLFYASVAKATPDFNLKDYPTTKTYKLRNIYFSDVITFEGALTNYAGDIVILQLSEKVAFSPDVLPACLHLDERDHFYPGKNVTGKLSGFGATADESFPSALLSANLPYISYGECKKRVRNDFRTFISTDKFCAGSENGSGARKGDSGGGLLFMDDATKLYHLRGVVSTRDLSDSSIATFTDVAQYMSWIVRTKKAIENESKSCKCNANGSSSRFCDSNTMNCQCKAFVTGTNCDTCRDGYWKLRVHNSNGCTACGCSSDGSYSSVCHKISGSCQCKPSIIGRRCDECADRRKVLVSDGCVDGPKWVKFSHGDRCSNAMPLATDTNDTRLIIRIPITEVPVGGEEEVSTYKLDSIPLFGSEWPSSEYEMLCGGLVKWVKSEVPPVPEGAVVSRVVEKTNIEGPYSETYHVCQGFSDDVNLNLPGERYPNGSCITYFGGEQMILSNFLYNLRSTNTTDGIEWMKYSGENRCSNAVKIDGPNEPPRFIVRFQINESFESGQSIPNYRISWIPKSDDERERDNESERHFSEFEVLCGDSLNWDYQARPEAPRGAVVSRQVDTIYPGGFGTRIRMHYVCRAVADDGLIYVGEQLDNDEYCVISVGGKQIKRIPGEYDFLIADV